ncbi:MAG: Uma2 family endonuclease [Treponema sp.]|jgi:Uma2 family endonuclease|nr:Uma2 family endonuclease [Treponema sp.]
MLAAYKEESYYTCADVLEWDEEIRAEIIGGELFMMSAPDTAHQDISREIFVLLCNFLKGKKCTAYAAPFGVRLFPQKDYSDDTYVEPDIVVICDTGKIDKRGCNGAPDMVVEILSPSSVRRDRIVKFRLYQKAGVREYWIVDPETRSVSVHLLSGGNYVTWVYDETDEASVSILPGCVIPLKEVFPAAE